MSALKNESEHKRKQRELINSIEKMIERMENDIYKNILRMNKCDEKSRKVFVVGNNVIYNIISTLNRGIKDVEKIDFNKLPNRKRVEINFENMKTLNNE